MAKKRSKQVVSASSSQRSQPLKPSSRSSVKSHTNRQRGVTTTFCILFFIVSLLIYRQKYSNTASTTVVDDADKPYVYQRALVKTDSTYSDILNVTYSYPPPIWFLFVLYVFFNYLVSFQDLQENTNVSENISRRHFENPILAYITPWYLHLFYTLLNRV